MDIMYSFNDFLDDWKLLKKYTKIGLLLIFYIVSLKIIWGHAYKKGQADAYEYIVHKLEEKGVSSGPMENDTL